MRTEDAAALLRSVLGLPPGQAVLTEPAPGPNRNTVFRVIEPAGLFLKLYRADGAPDAAFAEAAAAQVLGATIPVPSVRAHGFHPDWKVGYLVTSAVPGERLDTLLEAGPAARIAPILAEIVQALERIAGAAGIAEALRFASQDLVGPYAADFSPVSWVLDHDRFLAPVVEGLGNPGTAPLLGSLSTNNVLLSEQGGVLALSGFLDFEGTRVGPKGFDQAMMWYDLMHLGHTDLADHWFRLVSQYFDRQSLQGTIANAAWLAAFRVSHHHPERESDLVLRPLIKEKLAAFRQSTATTDSFE